jgi:hypothetical protein
MPSLNFHPLFLNIKRVQGVSLWVTAGEEVEESGEAGGRTVGYGNKQEKSWRRHGAGMVSILLRMAGNRGNGAEVRYNTALRSLICFPDWP